MDTSENTDPGKPKKSRFFFSRTFLRAVAGITIGAVIGLLYYHFYGCTNACAITGHPVNSMLAGGLLGYLITTF